VEVVFSAVRLRDTVRSALESAQGNEGRSHVTGEVETNMERIMGWRKARRYAQTLEVLRAP
jgi:hypothetical protein